VTMFYRTDIKLAVVSGVVGHTVTLIVVHMIYAHTIVLAWRRYALVYVHRTSTSHSILTLLLTKTLPKLHDTAVPCCCICEEDNSLFSLKLYMVMTDHTSVLWHQCMHNRKHLVCKTYWYNSSQNFTFWDELDLEWLNKECMCVCGWYDDS